MGFPKQDDYDKLPNAVNVELYSQGRSYINSVDEYEVVIRSRDMYDLRMAVSIMINNHLEELSKKHLDECLLAIQKAKETMTSGTEEEEEELLKVIEDNIALLTPKLADSKVKELILENCLFQESGY